jgi:hypothetical protein
LNISFSSACVSEGGEGRCGAGVTIHAPGGLGVFITVKSEGSVVEIGGSCSLSDEVLGGPGRGGRVCGVEGISNSTLEAEKEKPRGGVDNTELDDSSRRRGEDEGDRWGEVLATLWLSGIVVNDIVLCVERAQVMIHIDGLPKKGG